MTICCIPYWCSFISWVISMTGSTSVMRILWRIFVEANNQILTSGIVAQNHAHLSLCPAAVILARFLLILRSNQCSHLYSNVVPCTAPGIFAVILAFASCLGIQISGNLCPVRSTLCDFCLQDCSTHADIIPVHRRINAPLATGLTGHTLTTYIHKGIQEGLVAAVACCQIQPACCPCLVIIVVIGIVIRRSCFILRLVVLHGEVIQSLCILQVFCIPEVDVVDSQSCGISCCDVACTIACPISSPLALNGFLCFCRTPVAVVIAAAALSDLIAEVCNGITTQGCAVLEVLAEPIGDFFQVCSLTQRIICILKFVVAPAQSCCGITSRHTKLYVVTCIVETANHFIASVAIATPVKCRSRIYIITAHISIIEIHGILQQFCVVVRVRRMNRQIG